MYEAACSLDSEGGEACTGKGPLLGGGSSPGWPVVAGAGWLNFNFPILDSN